MQKDGKISYADFVWFLLSEEDKKTPTRWAWSHVGSSMACGTLVSHVRDPCSVHVHVTLCPIAGQCTSRACRPTCLCVWEPCSMSINCGCICLFVFLLPCPLSCPG